MLNKKFIIKNILLTFIVSLFIIGCGGKSKPPLDVKVKKEYNSYWDYYYDAIKITSLEDNVLVKKVVVNNGNCKRLLFENPGNPGFSKTPPQKPLNLGDNFSIRTNRGCNVIKIDVITNKGDWSWKFNP